MLNLEGRDWANLRHCHISPSGSGGKATGVTDGGGRDDVEK
jgi:hypothetical protein